MGTIRSYYIQLLMCCTTSIAKTYIRAGEEKISSSEDLKILGFIFGTGPSIKPHIDYMLCKANKKLWMLRHVKKAGMSQADLLKIFETVIRPTLEFAVPTYHPMLTEEMSNT